MRSAHEARVLRKLRKLQRDIQELASVTREVQELQNAATIDVPTAAERLGVSERTVHRRIERGVIVARRIGRSFRIQPWALALATLSVEEHS